MSHRILLVDDEIDILEFVRYNLQKEGYEVFTAQNGAEALKAAAKYRPHLILLDMMMPVMDGAQTCRAIRQDPQLRDTMVVFLSALGEEDQQLTGFGVGADDYLTKPFSPLELSLRVEALIRRCASNTDAPVLSDAETAHAAGAKGPQEIIRIGDLEIDLDGYEVKLKGQPVKLTSKEFEIVALLVSSPGKVFTREQILDHIWGESIGMDLRNITVLVRKIREKMEPVPSEPRYLLTVWRVGYKFASA